MEITYVRIAESADKSRPAQQHLAATRESTTTLCGETIEPDSTLLWTGDPDSKTHSGAFPDGIHEACIAEYRKLA
jgi:hypothetical protein